MFRYRYMYLQSKCAFASKTDHACSIGHGHIFGFSIPVHRALLIDLDVRESPVHEGNDSILS